MAQKEPLLQIVYAFINTLNEEDIYRFMNSTLIPQKAENLLAAAKRAIELIRSNPNIKKEINKVQEVLVEEVKPKPAKVKPKKPPIKDKPIEDKKSVILPKPTTKKRVKKNDNN